MDNSLITYVLIVLNVLVSLKGFSDPEFTERYLYKPFNQKHYKEHYRLITHMFLHADPVHLIFNMITLYYFGKIVENVFMWDFGFIPGKIMFLVFYLLGGLFSTLIPYARHKDNEMYRSLGASGAVSAVLFAGIIFFPHAEISIFFIPGIPAYIFGPLYLLFEFIADRYGKTRIAHDAHIGGALFGILFVLITNIDRVNAFINTVF